MVCTILLAINTHACIVNSFVIKTFILFIHLYSYMYVYLIWRFCCRTLILLVNFGLKGVFYVFCEVSSTVSVHVHIGLCQPKTHLVLIT